ncbi:MAG: winged helix-turn-helix transcriptional regulator [Wenzhouxiangellaceae bacterium]|nr:winged helix-turn-helix transcriptional regulator [Wenzhouxiangellaceae bacterium]
MSPTNWLESNCPIARVTDLLGEGWVLLLLREAFLGTRRFNDFERELGIARNILSDRLKKLVAAGVMERHRSAEDGRVVEYRLTQAGRELFPVLVGLGQWAGTWLCEGSQPMRVVERESGREVAPLQVRSLSGRALGPGDVRLAPGPGADPATAERYARAIEAAS